MNSIFFLLFYILKVNTHTHACDHSTYIFFMKEIFVSISIFKSVTTVVRRLIKISILRPLISCLLHAFPVTFFPWCLLIIPYLLSVPAPSSVFLLKARLFFLINYRLWLQSKKDFIGRWRRARKGNAPVKMLNAWLTLTLTKKKLHNNRKVKGLRWADPANKIYPFLWKKTYRWKFEE